MILPASLPSERISVTICSFEITMTTTRNSMQKCHIYYIFFFLIILISSLQSEFITHPLSSSFYVVFIDFAQVLDHCIHEVILSDIPKHHQEDFICIFYSLYILLYLFPKFQINNPYRIQTFFGHSTFLKSLSEWFSDTQNPSMMRTGGPNILDTRCTERSIFVSLENIFISKCSWTILFSFYIEYTENKQCKIFLGSILGCPYKSNGNKTCLDAALTAQTPLTNVF